LEKSVLRIISVLKKHEILKVWRKLNYSTNIIRIIKSRGVRLARHVACMVMINSCKVLVGILEAKRLLCRPRCRWEDNHKMYCREITWGGVDWIYEVPNRYQWFL
jgi:hypothetical protein